MKLDDATVLSLITLPNILLAFAQHITSPVRSSAMTDIIPAALTTGEEEEEDDSDRPGELEVTPELLESFEQLLIRENIELKFFEGDWSGMKVDSTLGEMMKYDIVLTSETIYSLPSLPSLLQLLKSASTIRTSELSSTMEVEKSLCLVACKRIYFGVGGGELEFKRRVSEMGATVESIWGHGVGEGRSQGVGRVVMNVDWSTSLMV
jgi:protein-histidine N-methyltransferase